MRQVSGTGFLAVVPEREKGGAGRVGSFLGGDEGGQLGGTHGVFCDGFRVAYAYVPPSGAPDALEQAELVAESGESFRVR